MNQDLAYSQKVELLDRESFSFDSATPRLQMPVRSCNAVKGDERGFFSVDVDSGKILSFFKNNFCYSRLPPAVHLDPFQLI